MDHNIKDDTADEPEVDLGPGVKRIQDDTYIDDMLDDTISRLFKLVDDIGNTRMQKTCKVKGCEEEAVISQETVSSVVYFKWSSPHLIKIAA